MRETNRRQAWVRRARMAMLGAGVLLLAGCATGYSFVQPDIAGSGGYYTSPAPYSGQGYYDDYGTGPYYPGTSDYGYYNGTSPYSNPYGYYGGGYDYGYGPQWIFNLGISNVWDFPGYWGPWYTTGYPLGGCYSWRCGYRHHRHGHDHDDHDDHGAPKPWLEPDHPPVPRRLARGTPAEVRSRPVVQQPQEGFTNRRPVSATAFRHDRFVRAPRQHINGRVVGTPVRPAYTGAQVSDESAFANRRAPAAAPPITTPRDFNPPPRPAFRPAPPRFAASAAPPPRPAPARHRNTPSTKIP